MKTYTTKPQIIFLIAIFVAWLNPLAARAQQNQDLIDQQDWITRNQQNKLEEDKRDKEFDAIKKERARRKKELEELERQKLLDSTSAKTAQCFQINDVSLIGSTLISKSAQRKLLKPFVGKCIDGKELANLVSVVNRYYQNKGYVSAQVMVPKQNIQDGSLELKVIEGKIEEIILNDNSATDKMQEFTAFGNLEGEYLNLNEINQGIYQINRLPSNHAVMKIEPGSSEGESRVIVDNKKTLPVRATIGYDNLGNKFTGVRRTNFSGALDNLLFLNDSINLNYSTNLNDDNHQKNINSFSGNFAIPLHYYTLTFDYSKSDFRGTNQGISGPLHLTGFSDRKSFTLDRVLFYEGNLRISSSASLTQKESASYLNYVRIDNSQRKLTIANFAVSLSNYFENGINLYLKPSYSKGLKLLNAKKDEADLPANVAKAQFDLIKFYASISKKFILPKLNAPIILATEMDSQISKNTLYGSEQFSVGGYYSVRGFRENYVIGDSGYFFRNKISANLGSLLLPMIEEPEVLTYLNKFKLEPFYDYGHAQNRYNSSGGRLSGAGIKTIFESKYFNASITYSQALQKSKQITSPVKENKMLYFEVSATCC